MAPLRTLVLVLPLLLTGCPNDRSTEASAPPAAPAASIVAPSVTAPPPPPAPSAPPSSAPPPASATPPPASSGIFVPSSIGAEKRPFVLYLHGLGGSGKLVSDVIGLPALSQEKRFSWAAPDGAMGSKGQRFWNASKACCNFDNAATPHVEELRRLIDSAIANPAVDPKRVFVVGFSNGGFMAHRLACEVEGLAGIVSVAGAGPAEGEPCAPKAPVAVVAIHGDADEVIRYEGGQALGRSTLPRHPSALATISAWASREHCAPTARSGGTLDLDAKIEGAETSVLRFTGCDRPVELWTVQSASHYIGTSRRMQTAILDFVASHPRP